MQIIHYVSYQIKRQLSEKEQRRRKRLASRESSRIHSERTRQTVEVPRQCYGPQCQKRARPNSKYCSHECGIQVAVRWVLGRRTITYLTSFVETPPKFSIAMLSVRKLGSSSLLISFAMINLRGVSTKVN